MKPEQPLDTEKLWREFGDHLRSFVRKKISDNDEAEDVLQDIFVRIHRGLDGLREAGRVQSWVFGIARRAIADYYREVNRDPETESLARSGIKTAGESEMDPSVDTNDYEGDHDVHEEVLSWLIPMIDELPDKYGKPLRMADVEGKTQQEVAHQLGLSLSGAKSRVQRAREKLGEVLAACCEVHFGNAGRAVSYRKINQPGCEDC